MKLRNWMTVGLMMAGFATFAQAQSYYGGGYAPGRYAQERFERRDIGRDWNQHEALEQRVAADRRAVERERFELEHSPWYVAGHESREFAAARERLEFDTRALRAVERDFGHYSNDYGRGRYAGRY